MQSLHREELVETTADRRTQTDELAGLSLQDPSTREPVDL